MKKFFFLALLGTLFIVSPVLTFAQSKDSLEVVNEESADTISIDKMKPVFYGEETKGETSQTLPYAIGSGLILVAVGAFFYLRKKKKWAFKIA